MKVIRITANNLFLVLTLASSVTYVQRICYDQRKHPPDKDNVGLEIITFVIRSR